MCRRREGTNGFNNAEQKGANSHLSICSLPSAHDVQHHDSPSLVVLIPFVLLLKHVLVSTTLSVTRPTMDAASVLSSTTLLVRKKPTSFLNENRILSRLFNYLHHEVFRRLNSSFSWVQNERPMMGI